MLCSGGKLLPVNQCITVLCNIADHDSNIDLFCKGYQGLILQFMVSSYCCCGGGVWFIRANHYYHSIFFHMNLKLKPVVSLTSVDLQDYTLIDHLIVCVVWQLWVYIHREHRSSFFPCHTHWSDHSHLLLALLWLAQHPILAPLKIEEKIFLYYKHRLRISESATLLLLPVS